MGNSANQQAPNVSNMVGQAGALQSNIQGALNAPAGATGAPDISSIMRNVNAAQNTQNQIMASPGAGGTFGPLASQQSPGQAWASSFLQRNLGPGGRPK